jgi:NADPH:quinone reductase-like Zn-dependent oxidoreductase
MTKPPRTMQAILLKGHGGYDQLEFRDDVLVPVPGADEVLLRVTAAGLNNTDINTRTGWYSKSVTADSTATEDGPGFLTSPQEDSAWTGSAAVFPRIQGADACGEIVAVGKRVDPSRIGTRVIVDPVIRSPAHGVGARPMYFGSDWDGAFAEFAKVPAVNARSVSSTLSDVELASFPCAYSAAENMLTRADLKNGETVLITGASGGVGSAAVQLAKRRGAHVIAVAGASKSAVLQSLGASRVLPRQADLVAEIGLESVDVVVDIVGGPQFPQFLKILIPTGRYAVAGAIAGPIVDLDLRTLYLKDLRLLGCTIPDPNIFDNLLRYIQRAEVRPVVARTYPLSAIADAQRDFLSKQHTGKIVLLPPAQ